MRPFRMSACMGSMLSTIPHAIAQVTTTAQLSQIFFREDTAEREGQMWVLKAAVSPATEVGMSSAVLAMAAAQLPSACHGSRLGFGGSVEKDSLRVAGVEGR